MSSRLLKLELLGLLTLMAGCTRHVLVMKPELDLNNESAVTPDLAARKYSKIMILPPSGTSRGEFSETLAFLERGFLKRNITVVSDAITGRIVYDEKSAADSAKKITTGQELSDIERALIMAKQTGVDAVLQIGGLRTDPNRIFTRHFIFKDSQYTETFNLPEYAAWKGKKRQFSAHLITFTGKLVDVSSGKVMASFSYTGASNWSLPEEYRATINHSAFGGFFNDGQMLSQNFSYDEVDLSGNERDGAWVPAAINRVIGKMIDAVAQTILGDQKK